MLIGLSLLAGVQACDAAHPTGAGDVIAASAGAVPFADKHAALVAKNPAGLSLTLRLSGTGTRFRLGERIPIKLLFTSSEPGRNELDMRDSDRSGRTWFETFSVSPRGAFADPLGSYFGHSSSEMGGMGPPQEPITRRPLAKGLDLNEWVRFDKPGRHRLFVTSTRASVPLTSNIIEIEIVDDPAWAAAELARIRTVLASGRHGHGRRRALRSLRFLGTREAAAELVAQLCVAGEQHVSALHLGVHGSRDRVAMVSALEAGLDAPTCGVSTSYLSTLAMLKMAGQPPPADWQKAYARTVMPSVKALSAALPNKTRVARAVSIHTVLAVQREQEQPAAGADPVTKARRTELASLFHMLPEPLQARILADEWHTVRSAAMTPVLARLAAEARPRGGELRSLSDLALERWLQLDVMAARAFILAELARPDGVRVSFSGKTLSLLPDRALPNLDAALIAGMRALAADGRPVSDGATQQVRAEVTARYASGAVLEDVWQLYRESKTFRMSLLIYLLREDPETAGAVVERLPLADQSRLAELQ